jgi:hypothetical protein
MHTQLVGQISFPEYSGLRCLMMPYVQGDPDSVPLEFAAYRDIIESLAIERGEIGYLTIDESPVAAGIPHRGQRAKYGRALHTEAGVLHGVHSWGSSRVWGGSPRVTLDEETQILLANSMDGSCAVWDAVHADTSEDGDIGHLADMYPYNEAVMMRAGEVRQIGILTPHESLPVCSDAVRQFVRIVGRGVHGREEYFTVNPLVAA